VPKIKSVTSVDFILGTSEVRTPQSLPKNVSPPLGWGARISCVPGNPKPIFRKAENYSEHWQCLFTLNKLLAVINVSKDALTKGLRSGANRVFR